MRADRLTLWLFVALLAAAVVLGLVASGGPGTARAERRDSERMMNLRGLAGHVQCVANAAGGRLPEAIHPDPACNQDIVLNDPFDGTPYRYERSSDTSFRLCAGFERPQVLRPNRDFEASSGCLVVDYKPATRTP
ncbi:hypothetical protein [Ruixingdingia sedimenti]|uniref:Secreted protein n=1 Tax=Ruixingdingia sedimenti TaxID=3073604 RepID=A0ABU1F980_9RHOB|nr:hypothetical protein [Xinfangfangia sp. LG-4]MDR5653435.1 hypothetical protein [Xinfangfangia sp. LG-4]